MGDFLSAPTLPWPALVVFLARLHPSMLRHGGMGVVTPNTDSLMARPHPSMLQQGGMRAVTLKADFLMARTHPSMLWHGGMGVETLKSGASPCPTSSTGSLRSAPDIVI